jgi:hypothetical protein
MPRFRPFVALSILALLAGCTSGSSGSRHTLYDSLDALVADSTVAVVGQVLEVGETLIVGHPGTDAAFQVEEQYLSDDPLDEITVRQMGAAPTLRVGDTYLLFLVPTGLPDDPPLTYYVTGAVAGIYEFTDGEFRRVSDEDPGLPATVLPDELD